MSDILEAVDKAIEAIRRARRTLIVHPDDYGKVTARIYADGMSGVVIVEQNSHVNPGSMILTQPPPIDYVSPTFKPVECICWQPWGLDSVRTCPRHGVQMNYICFMNAAPGDKLLFVNSVA